MMRVRIILAGEMKVYEYEGGDGVYGEDINGRVEITMVVM